MSLCYNLPIFYAGKQQVLDSPTHQPGKKRWYRDAEVLNIYVTKSQGDAR